VVAWYRLEKMKFPMTRQRLQKYRVDEALSAEIKKGVLEEIQKICKGVEEVVLTTNERKYIYEITLPVKYGECLPSATTYGKVTRVTHNGIVTELLEEIKNKFPDSTIVMDPLGKYILIDWS